MINIEKLGFNNLEDIEFAEPPRCSCGGCNNSMHIVLKDEEEVKDALASLINGAECEYSAAVAIRANRKHLLMFPECLISKEDMEYDHRSFVLTKCEEGQTKKEFMNFFVDMVNLFDVHHVAILEEEPFDRGNYKIVSRNCNYVTN